MSMRVSNRFVDRVLTVAESDAFVAQEFLRVTGMVEPPVECCSRPSSFALDVAVGRDDVLRCRGRRRAPR